jgi:hypothetical protein
MVLRDGILRSKVLLLAGGLLGAALLGASGTSGGPSQGAGSAIKDACQEVSAVLSDGPAPSADPVGYAEAQILPLRRIHTSDRALQKAADDLAAAYQRYYDANGAGARVEEAVTSASHRLDAICPGAAS